jgi:AraC family ethanolamine operon transcriptional activator
VAAASSYIVTTINLIAASKLVVGASVFKGRFESDAAEIDDSSGGKRMVQAVQPIPSGSFATTETCDGVAHARCLSGWRDSHYEHVGRQPFRGRIAELCLWPVQIIYERVEQPCVYRGIPWAGGLMFLSKLAADGDIYCNGRRINEGTVTIFPWNFTSSAFLRGPACNVAIAVDERALADHARSILNQEISVSALRRSLSVTRAESVEMFEHTAMSIIGELTASPGLINEESYRTTIRQRLLDVLVQVLDAGIAAARQLAPPSPRSYIVERAARYMDTRLADPLQMSDICEAIRVSPRTLRYSFEEMVGVSPTQYLLAVRLSRVRRDLLHAGASSRINRIAERHGFAHMGRFAQFYSDAFGERPSDTARRAAVESQRFNTLRSTRAARGQMALADREMHRAAAAC